MPKSRSVHNRTPPEDLDDELLESDTLLTQEPIILDREPTVFETHSRKRSPKASSSQRKIVVTSAPTSSVPSAKSSKSQATRPKAVAVRDNINQRQLPQPTLSTTTGTQPPQETITESQQTQPATQPSTSTSASEDNSLELYPEYVRAELANAEANQNKNTTFYADVYVRRPSHRMPLWPVDMVPDKPPQDTANKAETSVPDKETKVLIPGPNSTTSAKEKAKTYPYKQTLPIYAAAVKPCYVEHTVIRPPWTSEELATVVDFVVRCSMYVDDEYPTKPSTNIMSQWMQTWKFVNRTWESIKDKLKNMLMPIINGEAPIPPEIYEHLKSLNYYSIDSVNATLNVNKNVLAIINQEAKHNPEYIQISQQHTYQEMPLSNPSQSKSKNRKQI